MVAAARGSTLEHVVTAQAAPKSIISMVVSLSFIFMLFAIYSKQNNCPSSTTKYFKIKKLLRTYADLTYSFETRPVVVCWNRSYADSTESFETRLVVVCWDRLVNFRLHLGQT